LIYASGLNQYNNVSTFLVSEDVNAIKMTICFLHQAVNVCANTTGRNCSLSVVNSLDVQ